MALSGGADSVFLAHFLKKLNCENVVVAHFSHQIRDEKTTEFEKKFCENLAKKFNWKFENEKWETPQKSEEKARAARFAFLRKIKIKNSARAILLAHHRDDRVETIFQNFLRGAGLRGIAAMKIFDGEIFRPLLNFSKKEILKFCENSRIKFCRDATNFDENFAKRNFLRLKILPKLREKFENCENSILRFSEICGDFENFFDEFFDEKISKIKNQNGGFSRFEFSKLSKFARGEFLRRIFAPRFFSFSQISQIDDFLKNGKSAKKKIFKNLEIKIFGEYFFVNFLDEKKPR